MNIQKTLATLLLACAGLGAHASPVPVAMVPDGSGGYSVGLSVTHMAGEFTDVFDLTGTGDLALFGGSVQANASYIQFTDLDINGQNFSQMLLNGETVGMLDNTLLEGPFVLTISGDVLSSVASYSAQINVNPVPEPAVLALVALALLAAGMARRSRNKTSRQSA